MRFVGRFGHRGLSHGSKRHLRGSRWDGPLEANGLRKDQPLSSGCDVVCQQVSSLALSMRLPFISYECPSPSFSEEVSFPALARLGTVARTGTLRTIQSMRLDIVSLNRSFLTLETFFVSSFQ